MKRRASAFFKRVVNVLVALVKAKSVAAKGKVGTIRARLALLGLFRNKKMLMNAISHKIHAIMNNEHHGHCKAIVVYNEAAPIEAPPLPLMLTYHEDGGDANDDGIASDDDRYPDLRHSLFDEEDDGLGDCTGSVIDLVRNARGEEEGEFVLEDEIDHVADMFIKRFHKQMRLQKLQSFKEFKEMMERSV